MTSRLEIGESRRAAMASYSKRFMNYLWYKETEGSFIVSYGTKWNLWRTCTSNRLWKSLNQCSLTESYICCWQLCTAKENPLCWPVIIEKAKLRVMKWNESNWQVHILWGQQQIKTASKKLYICMETVWWPRILIIWHLSGPMAATLKEFYCTVLQMLQYIVMVKFGHDIVEVVWHGVHSQPTFYVI